MGFSFRQDQNTSGYSRRRNTGSFLTFRQPIPSETRSLQSSLSRKRPEKNQAKDRKVDGKLQANYCSHCGTCLKDKRVGSFDPIRKYAQTIFTE